ncbi:MAG TPA: tetratricopeptide repeat protein [Gemmatimonadales bacterium]|nr:tetratricopeptide repeat protein [Gemmatimonadales bacterium]
MSINQRARYSLAVSPLVLFALACGGSEGTDVTRTTTAAASVRPSAAVSAQPAAEMDSGTPVVATPPSSAPAMTYDDAEAAFHAGHYTEATDGFTGYTESHPENPWGFYMLGLSAWKAGNQGEALHAFDEALALDPNHVKSLLNSSRVLIELGRAEEAVDRLNTALTVHSSSNDAYRLLGRAHALLGESDSAVGAYHHAIALDPRDAWAMNNLGLLYLDRGQAGDALPPLVSATRIRDNSPVFQNNLGQALEHAGYFSAAASAYETALAADSGYTKASVGLSRVQGREDQPSFGALDLDALALAFKAQVDEWRGALDSAGEVEDSAESEMTRDSTSDSIPVVADSAVTSQPDSEP